MQGVVVAEALAHAQQQAQVHRVRELRGLAEAAVRRVEGAAQAAVTPRAADRGVERRPAAVRSSVALANRFGDCSPCRVDLVAAVRATLRRACAGRVRKPGRP